ncbi:pyruvate kinase isozyme chloroplastic [Raphidocelis subcapitata]|uniref:Pyruvate kinase n=1 Tax=Raphidocelis subcapitata TaxID=307507 RepID=A0A2V0P6B2_9CHLO|nr:pyruvate kinase isozyme chloroplastic [Raphidocelis subcapitata]|eukprot:GBF95398.1 pyruvate kinase isozyme chloroplastic [Raphidocelis subcapitata]
MIARASLGARARPGGAYPTPGTLSSALRSTGPRRCVRARQSPASTETVTSEALQAENGAEAGPLASLDGALGLRVDERATHALSQAGGLRQMCKTKVVCTIGPATASLEGLTQLADAGMNVARLNMTHGTHAWHESVIEKIHKINKEKGYCIAIMVDTEGSEIHTGEISEPIKTEVGTRVCFTVRDPPPPAVDGLPVVGIGYGAFTDDVEVGDHLFIDGGMVELVVTQKAGPDVIAQSVEKGLILSRANVTCRREGELIRGRAAMLSVITGKDWRDIDWAIKAGIDFLAISFVRSADALHNLRSYITQRAPGHPIELIAKLEAFDCLANMDSIIEAADGIMVARGDLGAQVPVEDVPSIQKYAVTRARQLGKPAMVAHQLLHSMIEFPIPTRAEVADVADVVRQKADALMLSGESAMGAYPTKSLGVLRDVATRMEAWGREEKFGAAVLPQLGTAPDERVSEELCASAALMANNLGAVAILAYTRRGNMAAFLSRCRPDCPIFALTDREDVRRRLALRWGVLPFLTTLTSDFEGNVQRTLSQLKERGFVRDGDLVVVVSDVRSQAAPHQQQQQEGQAAAPAAAAERNIRSVQVRHVR